MGAPGVLAIQWAGFHPVAWGGMFKTTKFWAALLEVHRADIIFIFITLLVCKGALSVLYHKERVTRRRSRAKMSSVRPQDRSSPRVARGKGMLSVSPGKAALCSRSFQVLGNESPAWKWFALLEPAQHPGMTAQKGEASLPKQHLL